MRFNLTALGLALTLTQPLAAQGRYALSLGGIWSTPIVTDHIFNDIDLQPAPGTGRDAQRIMAGVKEGQARRRSELRHEASSTRRNRVRALISAPCGASQLRAASKHR